MLKMAGCVMVFVGCLFMGYFKALSFRGRCIELENILEILKLMELEITYRKEPLAKMFRKVSESRKCWFTNVLVTCSDMMEIKYSLRDSWTTALNEWQAGCPLEKEDVDILRDMVSGLGRSDSRSQSRIFTPAALRLEANLKKAAEREEKLGRMYKALGTAAGIVIVILII